MHVADDELRVTTVLNTQLRYFEAYNQDFILSLIIS